MILIGVDPSAQSTGYGVIEQTKRGFKTLEYGCIPTSSGQELPVRIEILYDALDQVIKQYRPEELSVESIFFGKNVKTLLLLGHMRSAALLAAQKNGVHVVEISAKAVKKSVTGNGAASKEQVSFMVRRILGLSENERIPLDATDALAVALAHGMKITF